MASSSSAAAAAPGPLVPSGALCWQRPLVSYAAGMPAPRGGHTASLVGNLMVVVGGTFYQEGVFHYLNDVWAYDVDTSKWHKPVLGGKGSPGPRYGHAATVIDFKVYVFGGKGENGLLYNDLWVLDVERWTWELLPSTSAPPLPRMGHSLVAVDGRLVVTCGWDSKTGTYGDLWVYSREQFQWTKPKVGGMVPTPRYGASVLFDEPNARLVLFGGTTYDAEGHPVLLNDARVLNLRAMEWSRTAVTGDFPKGRYWHAATTVGNLMVTVGGWTGPEKKPTAPAPGSAEAQITTLPAAPAGTITIPHRPGMGFGPDAPENGVMTVPFAVHPGTYFLDLDSMEWVAPQIAGKAPGLRYGSSVVSLGLSTIYYGGWEDGRAIGELLVLNLEAIASRDG
jgi:hypothetical protein